MRHGRGALPVDAFSHQGTVIIRPHMTAACRARVVDRASPVARASTGAAPAVETVNSPSPTLWMGWRRVMAARDSGAPPAMTRCIEAGRPAADESVRPSEGANVLAGAPMHAPADRRGSARFDPGAWIDRAAARPAAARASPSGRARTLRSHARVRSGETRRRFSGGFAALARPWVPLYRTVGRSHPPAPTTRDSCSPRRSESPQVPGARIR